MKLSFGIYRGIEIGALDDKYLCWMCATYKGGFKSHRAGVRPWNEISVDEYLEARGELKKRGYNTKGIWPIKEEN